MPGVFLPGALVKWPTSFLAMRFSKTLALHKVLLLCSLFLISSSTHVPVTPGTFKFNDDTLVFNNLATAATPGKVAKVLLC